MKLLYSRMPLCGSAIIQCQKQVRFLPEQRQQILFKYLYSVIQKYLRIASPQESLVCEEQRSS